MPVEIINVRISSFEIDIVEMSGVFELKINELMLIVFIFNFIFCQAQDLNFTKAKTQKIAEAFKKNEKKFYPQTVTELSKNKIKNRNLPVKIKKLLNQEIEDLDRVLLEINQTIKSK